ncbi:TVP38/TMEM64 family protein [Niallia sp. 01092]|uniref:TVP38/TMEM64 family protein n=1 Tax=unclassified Niallia TaxID=2837522 RepID=UPI003FD361DC
MTDYLLNYLPSNPILSAIISITLNILIAIFGFLPSAFLTGANIHFFSFEKGVIISIIGESLGALVSFIIYRKGIYKIRSYSKNKNNLLKRLENASTSEAIILIIILRILPFIPSGVVTLTAAFSKIKVGAFTIASTIGKIPSLLIEAYSINKIFNIKSAFLEENIIYITIILLLLYIFIKIRKKK